MRTGIHHSSRRLRADGASLAVIALLLHVIATVQISAQGRSPQYRLVVLPGLGGPGSFVQNGFDGILNDRGQVVGWADTAQPDPFPDFCASADCRVVHGFASENGHLKDLGTLAGGASSLATWISPNGLITGNAENGQSDPLVPGFPQLRPVLWRGGHILNLGTLSGGNEAVTGSVNSRGEVVGSSLNGVPSPYSGFGTAFRAFWWTDGHMRDLGTLGGPEAQALLINESGQIAGFSMIDSIPQPGSGMPIIDPFFWSHGKMYDVGGLGGTFGQPFSINSRGQMVGISNLAGDKVHHPFLWHKGVLTDLGTLGGDNGDTNWISDSGIIAGKADLPGPAPQNHNAVIWEDGKDCRSWHVTRRRLRQCLLRQFKRRCGRNLRERSTLQNSNRRACLHQ